MGRLARKLEKIKLSDQQFEEMKKYIKQQTVLSDVDFAILPMPKVKLDFDHEFHLMSEQ